MPRVFVGHEIDHDIADHCLDPPCVIVQRLRNRAPVRDSGFGDLDEIVDDMTERDQTPHHVPPFGRR